MIAASTSSALAGSCKVQSHSVSIVEKIGIERQGALEFGDGGIVPALRKQDKSELSASLRQAGVEAHRRLRQFKGTIERGGSEIIGVERLEITV
jgi:hypothetical protein